MRTAVAVVIATAVVAGLSGCAAASVRISATDGRAVIPAELPPSPTTWPQYPRFSQHSCWAAPDRRGVLRTAPSYLPSPERPHLRPAEIARRFLARFGDRRYIHSLAFTSALPAYLKDPSFDFHPPPDGLNVLVDAPLANDRNVDAKSTPEAVLVHAIAGWEADLVFGALRDDFCSADGVPLVSAYGHGHGASTADAFYALEQRFPNPSPAAFRQRVAVVGKRFGFEVVSLRLLRPEQIAPLLIVRTSRKRSKFSAEVPRILQLLSPSSGDYPAETFEGFFFAAEDAKGPFVLTENVSRGIVYGGQWAASENLYPFVHG